MCHINCRLWLRHPQRLWINYLTFCRFYKKFALKFTIYNWLKQLKSKLKTKSQIGNQRFSLQISTQRAKTTKLQLTLHDITTSDSVTLTFRDFISWSWPAGEMTSLTKSTLHIKTEPAMFTVRHRELNPVPKQPQQGSGIEHWLWNGFSVGHISAKWSKYQKNKGTLFSHF